MGATTMLGFLFFGAFSVRWQNFLALQQFLKQISAVLLWRTDWSTPVDDGVTWKVGI